MYIDEARAIAARAWCDSRNSGKAMDVDLCESFAELLAQHTPDTYHGDVEVGDFIMVTRGELIPQVVGGGGGLYGSGGGRLEQIASRDFVNQVLKVVAIDGATCVVKNVSPNPLYGEKGTRPLDLYKVEYRKVAKEVAAALNPPKED